MKSGNIFSKTVKGRHDGAAGGDMHVGHGQVTCSRGGQEPTFGAKSTLTQKLHRQLLPEQGLSQNFTT
eukprot:3692727-Amphidinium_carterae.1